MPQHFPTTTKPVSFFFFSGEDQERMAAAEHQQGRYQLGPGGVHLWSVRPVRDLNRPSIYRDLLETVHGYYKRIPQAFRLLHLENPNLPPQVRNTFVTTTSIHDGGGGVPLHVFPGSIPHSLMRAEIPIFYSGIRKYVFLYKGDGQRLFLGFGRLRGRPVCFFMTRTAFFYLLPLSPHIPASFYDGTLIDAEFIHDGENKRLEMFDAIAICGHLVGHYNYLVRLHLLHYLTLVWQQISTITNNHQQADPSHIFGMYDALTPMATVPYSPRHPEMDLEDPLELPISFSSSSSSSLLKEKKTKEVEKKEEVMLGVFQIRPKNAYSIFELHKLLKELLPKMPAYAQEGLIAMPVEDCISPGPCPRIKKIKPSAELNTLDLCVSSMQSKYDIGLWAEWPEREVESCILPPPFNKTPPIILPFKDTKLILFHVYKTSGNSIQLLREDGTDPKMYTWEQLRGKIVECKFNATSKVWTPYRLRDKRKPNTMQTAIRTVQNMDLSYDEIFPFLNDPAGPPHPLQPHQKAMQIEQGYARRLFQHLLYRSEQQQH